MGSSLHIALAAERVGTLWGIPITNALITGLLISLLLIVVGVLVGQRAKLIPGKMQNAFEMLFEFVLDYMEQTLGSRRLAERYFPLIATIFLFIFCANELEFFPLVGSIGFYHNGQLVPLLRGATSDLNLSRSRS